MRWYYHIAYREVGALSAQIDMLGYTVVPGLLHENLAGDEVVLESEDTNARPYADVSTERIVD